MRVAVKHWMYTLWVLNIPEALEFDHREPSKKLFGVLGHGHGSEEAYRSGRDNSESNAQMKSRRSVISCVVIVTG